MKIINAHVHAIELQGMLNNYPHARFEGTLASGGSLSQLIPHLGPDTILRQMDEANISQSVLFAVDAPIVFSSNEYVATLCKKYPDRFIGFASVNPTQPDALDSLMCAIEKGGLRGVKFHPPLQNFIPNDEKCFPVYAAIEKWGIPAVFHVGTTPFGCVCSLRGADPLMMDDLAVKFPLLKIVLTHLGTLWHQEAFMVVEKNQNVYIDTAAYLYEIPQILTSDLITRIGAKKFLFGTDFPMPSPGPSSGDEFHSMKAFVEQIQQLPLAQEIKEGILGRNFEMMLNTPATPRGITLAELMKELKPENV